MWEPGTGLLTYTILPVRGPGRPRGFPALIFHCMGGGGNVAKTAALDVLIGTPVECNCTACDEAIAELPLRLFPAGWPQKRSPFWVPNLTPETVDAEM